MPFSEDLVDGQLFGVGDPSSMICLYKKVKAKTNARDASQISTLTLPSLFAFFIIIVLLNVVIAIVVEAWESAEAELNRLFWKYRLEKIFELRYALKLKERLSTRIFGFQNSCHELLEKIDNIRDLSYASDVSWTKAPYKCPDRERSLQKSRKILFS